MVIQLGSNPLMMGLTSLRETNRWVIPFQLRSGHRICSQGLFSESQSGSMILESRLVENRWHWLLSYLGLVLFYGTHPQVVVSLLLAL